MFNVKITTGDVNNAKVDLRQLSGFKPISLCGKYKFYFDDSIKEPDFWVVRNKYIKKPETLVVAPENTILMISEPKSVISFPQKYVDQFGVFVSCQETSKHRNLKFNPPLLPWFVGIDFSTNVFTTSLSYDSLKNSIFPPKSKLISVITSNKAFTQGHLDRIDFVEKLKTHYGDLIDVFGRGFNSFDDKWDVLAPYKYHISIENSSSKYYWTEKLSDCYLAGTYPIYYGCTNVDEYFPKESFSLIDIHNFENAVKIIDSIIENDVYNQSLDALHISKKLVLDEYNMFNQIARVCDTLNPDAEKKDVTLKPAITILDYRNFYKYFFERNIFALKKALRKVFKKKSVLKTL